jgi:hypothetical protein
MTITNDELRRRLRRADPAAGKELHEDDRVRMRSRLVAHAARGKTAPRLVPAVLLATTAAAVLTMIVLLPQPVGREMTTAVPEGAAQPTRIYFTGPEGTKIQWFVTNPDTKEHGS